VVDFHRVRSRRAYEFTLLGSGEKVAQGVTDWVYLENGTNKPATIPEEIVNAFFPDGHGSDYPPREKFPIPPAPPSGKYDLHLRVTWQDLDPVQHVNNATYLILQRQVAPRD
jgi:acyl-CoA thioesterase FadM